MLLGYRRVPRSWIPPRRDIERKRAAAAHQERLSRLAASERPPASRVLRIIPRERWCTTPARGGSAARHSPGIGHVVHWFGPGRAATDLAGGVAQVNSFAHCHILTLGWADIGYGWLILRDGRNGELCTVLEGRGRNVRGAHSGHNVANGQPGVCLLAGTESPEATPEQLLTLQALRTSERWGRRTGHIEWYPTTCPGPEIQPWVIANR
ncbi:MAG: hypothetical protein RIB67_03430 [Miltoncostaeaceae bacterium]